jgi:Domain of unknown function (DUF397)
VDLSRIKWHKSTYSVSDGCVEVAFVADLIAVRNSKDAGGPTLIFTTHEWEAFLAGVRGGEFDQSRTQNDLENLA